MAARQQPSESFRTSALGQKRPEMFTLTMPSSPTSESTTLALAADLGVAGTCSGPPPAPPPPCSVAVPSWQSVACVGESLSL